MKEIILFFMIAFMLYTSAYPGNVTVRSIGRDAGMLTRGTLPVSALPEIRFDVLLTTALAQSVNISATTSSYDVHIEYGGSLGVLVTIPPWVSNKNPNYFDINFVGAPAGIPATGRVVYRQ